MTDSEREMLALAGDTARPPVRGDGAEASEVAPESSASGDPLRELSASSAGVLGGKITVRSPDGGNIEIEGFVVGVFAVRNRSRRMPRPDRRVDGPFFVGRCGRFCQELVKHQFFATILDGLHRLMQLKT
jgi:hypothetical protein